jgi:hypothetical protein
VILTVHNEEQRHIFKMLKDSLQMFAFILELTILWFQSSLKSKNRIAVTHTAGKILPDVVDNLYNSEIQKLKEKASLPLQTTSYCEENPNHIVSFTVPHCKLF